MRLRRPTFLLGALCAAAIFCGNAIAADYFISFSNLGVASCDQTHIEGNVTASYSLPAGPNNLIATLAINGGIPSTFFLSLNPPIDSGSQFFSYPIPTTTQPYTVTGTVYPAVNGAAAGIGFTATYTCNVNGTLTAVFVPTPATGTPIPTLSEWALALLMLLVAAGSVITLRRKA